MNLYDIHAHLADSRILTQADDLVRRAVEAGVRGIVVNAARIGEWEAVCTLTQHGPVFGALGLHPFFVESWTPDCAPQLRRLLAQHDKVLAIGEIGLDFWNGRENLNSQMQVFREQLLIAQDMDLPVILHNRKSWGECLGLLKEEGFDDLKGVCHCFNGSRELARQLLDRGLMISFCGPVTYNNARKIRDVAAYVPADRLLTETDAPDLPPKQVKPGNSEPQHVRFILHALANIRQTTPEDLAAQIEENVRVLFGRDVIHPSA